MRPHLLLLALVLCVAALAPHVASSAHIDDEEFVDAQLAFDDWDDADALVGSEDDGEDGDPDPLADASKSAAGADAKPDASHTLPLGPQTFWYERAAKRTTYVEVLLLLGAGVWVALFVRGKRANVQLAERWRQHFLPVLTSQFCHDRAFSGLGNDAPELLCESYSSFQSAFSGREGVKWLLAKFTLRKRQDLASTLLFESLGMAPTDDRLTFVMSLDDADVAPICVALCRKLDEKHWNESLADIKALTTTNATVAAKYKLPDSLTCLCDTGSAAGALFGDGRVRKALSDAEPYLRLLHFTDTDRAQRRPSAQNVVRLEVALPEEESPEAIEALQNLLVMVIWLADQFRAIRLSPAARTVAEKSRKAFADAEKRANQGEREAAIAERREKKFEEMTPAEQKKALEKQKRKEQRKRKPRMKVVS